ncbi:MAG TPA: hypothetical protein VHV57_11240 [Acidimicrobiales bacterium]|jgi:hypothetical protein|nr:hypothetical protein [Acidimicrobiales bacterium]
MHFDLLSFLMGGAVALLFTVPRIQSYNREWHHLKAKSGGIPSLPGRVEQWRRGRAFGRLSWFDKKQVVAFVAFKEMVDVAYRTETLNVFAHSNAERAYLGSLPVRDGWSVGPRFPIPFPMRPYEEGVLQGSLPSPPSGT